MTKITSHTRRTANYLQRLLEIGLFTHTRCPTAVVAEAIAREDRALRSAHPPRLEMRDRLRAATRRGSDLHQELGGPTCGAHSNG